MRGAALAWLLAFALAVTDQMTGGGESFNGLDVLAWLFALAGVVLYVIAESLLMDRE